jgi:transcriptional regulator with XRE-family HTH domain
MSARSEALQWTKEEQVEILLEKLHAEIAMQIYQVREERGLSQTELAKKIGTSQSVISRVENEGYSGHSMKTLAKIAVALDLELKAPLLVASLAPDASDQPPASPRRSEEDALPLRAPLPGPGEEGDP